MYEVPALLLFPACHISSHMPDFPEAHPKQDLNWQVSTVCPGYQWP